MRTHALLALVTLSFAAAAGPAAAQPAVPAPLAPASGASVQVPLTISWSAVLDPGAINGGYNWQVSRSANFSPLVLADSTSPATTSDVVSGLVNGTYFWRVQAVDNATFASAWSMPRSFTVTGAGPGTPGTPVLAPTRGYSTFHPWEFIHFDWTAVPDAVTYRLEVSNDPSFPVGNVPQGVTTFGNDNIPTNSDGYVHTFVGNWFARVFAVSADNPQEGVRSLPSNVIQFSCFFNNPIGPPPELLSPLGNPTLTLPVPLRWAHVPNPQPLGYVLEVATDPGFSNVEFFFNQYTEPTQVMLSLTSGPKFWRVLSQHGLATPTTNANTDWSETGTFTISSAPSTPVSIEPMGNPDRVLYSGGSGEIALQLTAGVPAGGAAVVVTSSHPSLLPVPASISMPGGHAFATFPIEVGQVTTPTVVTLRATLNGVSASSQITIRPPTLNDEILQSVVRATGGTEMPGWVNLEGNGLAGPSGFAVSVSSDSPAALVPPTVTIPAGVNGTGFSIQTSPVTETTRVVITAAAGTVTTRWEITLTPGPAPTSFFVRPISTTNGSQGVVTTAEGVGHDQLVQVRSSNPALASVPPFATVAAVSGVGFFDITTAPVTAPTTVTISVSGGGVTLSQPLTIHPALPLLTGLSVTPGSVAGGHPATGTVTLAAPAPAVGVSINLGSNQPLTARVPASVTVPGGASSASFTVTTFPSSFTNTVQLSAALDGAFQFAAITVGPPAPPPAPSAPSLLSPANQATITPPVTLDWTDAAGATSYVLQIDNSSGFTTPLTLSQTVSASTATITGLPTGTLWWRVRSVNSAGVNGPFSGARQFTVQAAPPPGGGALPAPSLVAPAVDARFRPGQAILFDWSDVAGAATYTIQIDDSQTFAAPFVLDQTVSASSLGTSTLPTRRMWWRVRANGPSGSPGAWSGARRFEVKN